MKNLVFVIWMLGYPIASSLCNYLNPDYVNYLSDSRSLITFIEIIIWIIVGYKLYETNPDQEESE